MQKSKSQDKNQKENHVIEEITADLFIYQDPKLLKKEYLQFVDVSKINLNDIEKYIKLFSNLLYAWQKILKYRKYFEVFYPPEEKIDKIEALEHHIHAYLEDMVTLKNKIEILFREMKNDINKVALNKKDINNFFKVGVEKTKEVFAGVSKHRNKHRHNGMRFFDNDLLKAENAHKILDMILTNVFDEMNQEYKQKIIEKIIKEKEESFEVAKKRWIEIARKHDEQINNYLQSLLNVVRLTLYDFLHIKPVKDIIVSVEKII